MLSLLVKIITCCYAWANGVYQALFSAYTISKSLFSTYTISKSLGTRLGRVVLWLVIVVIKVVLWVQAENRLLKEKNAQLSEEVGDLQVMSLLCSVV